MAEAIGGELVEAGSFGDVEALAAPVPAGERYGGRAVYFSDVIVREDDSARSLGDLRGRRFAFNEERSHSGYNAVTAEMDFADFGSTLEVGSHVAASRRWGRGRPTARRSTVTCSMCSAILGCA